jgi:hypothetical protein
MGHDLRGRPGDGHADLLRADEAAGGLDALDAAVLDPHAGDFAVLDQVDAALSAPRA